STGWTCIEDLYGADTSVNISLTAGTTYYFMLDPEGTPGGNVTFNFTCPPTPPFNDICNNAITLAVSPASTCTISLTGSTAGATDNNETGDCQNGTETAVWYSFQATASLHQVTVNGLVGSFDPVIGAISACGTTTVPTGGACTDST